jgi:hypothetical protein
VVRVLVRVVRGRGRRRRRQVERRLAPRRANLTARANTAAVGTLDEEARPTSFLPFQLATLGLSRQLALVSLGERGLAAPWVGREQLRERRLGLPLGERDVGEVTVVSNVLGCEGRRESSSARISRSELGHESREEGTDSCGPS